MVAAGEVSASEVARRQAAYVESVGGASEWKSRLTRWDVDYDVPEEPLLPLAGTSKAR